MSCSKGLHSGWQHEFQKWCSWWSITALFRGELERLRHFFIASSYKHHWECHLPKNFQDSCRNSGPRLPKLLSWHMFLVADKSHVYLKKICWNVHNESILSFSYAILSTRPLHPQEQGAWNFSFSWNSAWSFLHLIKVILLFPDHNSFQLKQIFWSLSILRFRDNCRPCEPGRGRPAYFFTVYTHFGHRCLN